MEDQTKLMDLFVRSNQAFLSLISWEKLTYLINNFHPRETKTDLNSRTCKTLQFSPQIARSTEELKQISIPEHARLSSPAHKSQGQTSHGQT